MEIIKDIICQVYAGQKSRKTIDLVLNTFIPGYEKLNLDYTSRQDDKDYIFKSEDEMINLMNNVRKCLRKGSKFYCGLLNFNLNKNYRQLSEYSKIQSIYPEIIDPENTKEFKKIEKLNKLNKNEKLEKIKEILNK